MGLLNQEAEIDAQMLVAVVVSIITIRSHNSVKWRRVLPVERLRVGGNELRGYVRWRKETWRNIPDHILSSAPSLLPSLLLQFPTTLTIFCQPLEGDPVQRWRRGIWKCSSSLSRDERGWGKRPWSGFWDKLAETHVGNVSREIPKAIKDMGGVWWTSIFS